MALRTFSFTLFLLYIIGISCSSAPVSCSNTSAWLWSIITAPLEMAAQGVDEKKEWFFEQYFLVFTSLTGWLNGKNSIELSSWYYQVEPTELLSIIQKDAPAASKTVVRVKEAVRTLGLTFEGELFIARGYISNNTAAISPADPYGIMLYLGPFDDPNVELFHIYHELGHAYYKHTGMVHIVLPAVLLYILFNAVLARKLFTHFSVSDTIRFLAIAPLLLVSLIANRYTIALASQKQEIDADFFACYHLVKNGYYSAIASEIYWLLLEHDGEQRKQNTLVALINSWLSLATESHPSLLDRARLLLVYARKLGMLDIKSKILTLADKHNTQDAITRALSDTGGLIY